MSLIEFQDYPSTETPLNAENLNYNFSHIIESGSNDNGSYVKYSEGTLICYGVSTITSANPNTTTDKVVNLPYYFINTNYRVSFQKLNSGSYWADINEQVTNKTNNSFTIACWNSASQSSGVINHEYIAIGKWK